MAKLNPVADGLGRVAVAVAKLNAVAGLGEILYHIFVSPTVSLYFEILGNRPERPKT